MAGIRITGMASGLPPNIVDQIIDAERIPIKNIEASKTKVENKVKLVTDLETKVNDITKNLNGLVGRRGFTDKQFNSSFPDIVGGSIDPNVAVNGEWNIEVLQLAERPSAVSGGMPDRDQTRLGVGYLKFKTEEGTKEIYINQETSTLDGIAQVINESGTGLKAAVVNDRKDKDNPFKIQISGMQSGTDNQIDFPVVYLLDGERDFYFEQKLPSKNAKYKIDGMEFESGTNELKDVVPGVTLDLKRAAPGTPIRMNVSENFDSISGKIKGFVDAYNAALGFVQAQNKLDTSQKNPTLGPLGGDGMLRSVENRLRSIIQDPQFGVGGSIVRVGELGIEFNRNGTLNFSQDKFNATVKKNPMGVANFLQGDGFNTGFISSVKRNLDGLLNQNFGAISSRKKSYNDQIGQMNKRIEDKERQMVRKEESLRKKFADLEEKMSKLNSQGAAAGMIPGKIG